MTTTTQTTINKIDIHSHILYGVDDGSKSIEQTLNEISKTDTKTIICTPHMHFGRDEKINKIIKNFMVLNAEAKKIGKNILLGSEIMLSTETLELLKRKKLRSLNGTKYVLIELRRAENRPFEDIIEDLEEIQDAGYIVIFAHPELYINYRKKKYINMLKESNILLQMDATSYKDKYAKSLLKERLYDFVGSDCHCIDGRSYLEYDKAYKYILKKYGEDYTKVLFESNPRKLLKG